MSFWDDNPCDGNWNNKEQLINFRYERDPYILEMLEYIKPGKILEVGCGQGIDLVELAKKGKVIGIDTSIGSLKRARVINPYIRLIYMNAEQLKFRDNLFDNVYCYGVLHHTDKTQDGIYEIYRVLNTKGKAVVMLYNKYSPMFLIASILRALIPRRNIKSKGNSKFGTLLHELIGVPIFKGYSKRDLEGMFYQFDEMQVIRTNVGFVKLIPLIKYKSIKDILLGLDQVFSPLFGMYNWVVATK